MNFLFDILHASYKGLWRTLIFFPYWKAEKATRIVLLLVCGRELVFSTTHILIRVASQPSSMEQKKSSPETFVVVKA